VVHKDLIMGIDNIHILIHPDVDPIPNLQAQALALYQQELIKEHRLGEHPYGSMIRACPLCQAS
jgi:hypothetical protein